VRKIGGVTIGSIGQVTRLQTILDSDDAAFVPASSMLLELLGDTKRIAKAMRAAHDVADRHNDVATARILENFIDAAERRSWFLVEASRSSDNSER
jgi:starvation-inducible DNA-binding protein